MKPLILIPARLAAQRLPNKPLADIGGVPMIVRVLRQAEMAGVGPVCVAAGDQGIVDVVTGCGGDAVLTDPSFPSGTDRVKAAADIIDPDRKHDVVVNLQGDMPFVDPGVVSVAVDVLRGQSQCDISTVVAPEGDVSERTTDSVVKAVLAMSEAGDQGRALYFTRSILYGDGPIWHHLGVYGYRRDALDRFVVAPPSPLERRERLEQLRALELGMRIDAGVVPTAPVSVDTPDDLAAAQKQAQGT